MLAILKKPIVIAMFMFVVTYATLYANEQKRQTKYPESDKKPINIYIPGVVSILTYFIVSQVKIFRGNKEINQTQNEQNAPTHAPTPVPIQELNMLSSIKEQMGGAMKSVSDNLSRRGEIRLRQPDIFIDLVDY